ncbi:MAG: outer membrane protein assembly factor BamE [Candidatus Accumulibacter sp.]|jgi:outer membrane protein assembly factor BamE|nr:outer membrane protein assembly factor BamE [Accumulibacter sp.]
MPFHDYLPGIVSGMKNGRIAAGVFLALSVGACSWVPRPFTEYRIDIQQGNVLTQDMVAQLKLGLSKDQVRFILGTPVLMDMFHANRWDYIYRLRKGATGEVEERKFSTFFDDGGQLIRVSGDVAAMQPSDVSAEPPNKVREIDLGSVPEGTQAPPIEEKGFFGKMMESLGF